MIRVIANALTYILVASAFQSQISHPAPNEFNGFITTAVSNTEFVVGDLKVITSPDSVCGKLLVRNVLEGGVKEKRVPCNEIPIKVGNFYQVSGQRSDSGEFRATKILLWEQHPAIWAERYTRVQGDEQQGAAILEELPGPVSKSPGRQQTVWIAGVPLVIDDATSFFHGDTISRTDRMRYPFVSLGEKGGLLGKYSKESNRLGRTQLIPGIYVAYDAMRDSSGQNVAQKIVIMPGSAINIDQPIMPGVTRVVEPNYGTRAPGWIHLPYGDPAEIVPSQSIQQHVQTIGEKLIDQLMTDQRGGGTTIPDFRFYVVRSFKYDDRNYLTRLDGEHGGGFADFKAPNPPTGQGFDWVAGTPDGVILVPEAALLKLRNDAQLSFLLGVAVSSVLQHEASMIHLLIRLSSKYDLGGPYEEELENLREMRMAMRMMFNAKMDFCEAPFAWTGSAYTNPSPLAAKASESEPPWYVDYAFDVIGNFYPQADCGALTRGEDQYAEFLTRLREVIGQRQLEPPIPTR